jgi:RNA polymerase sigma factor (sigma-70 family)
MSTGSLASAVQQLHIVLDRQQLAQRSDRELLEAFVEHRDETSFAALVSRYGPMVLAVCRRLLRDETDAEDSFQATFLVLTSKANRIRQAQSLAGFLQGTARRIALQALRSASRRKAREHQVRPALAPDPLVEVTWREVQETLDKEIERLAEPYRTTFLLACREGLGHAETARRMGVKEATLRTWLSRARHRLQKRLSRQGIELGAVLAATAVASVSQAAVPAKLLIATAEMGRQLALGGKMVGLSANVIHLAKGATSSMFNKLRLTAIFFIAIGSLGLGMHSPKKAAPPSGIDLPRVAETRPQASSTVVLTGRVLDAAGKPVARASLSRFTAGSMDGPPPSPAESLGKSDDKGAFRVEVPRRALAVTREGKNAFLIATAPGHALGLVELQTVRADQPRDIRLARDDVPIEGQLLDLEGQPIKEATIRPMGLIVPISGDLETWQKSFDEKGTPRTQTPPAWILFSPMGIPGLPARLTSDDKGRFRLAGVGKERLVMVLVSAANMQSDMVIVATRTKPLTIGAPSAIGSKMVLHAASFRHTLSPPQPIIGTVRDRDTGKPISGVTISADPSVFSQTKTAADGTYRIASVPTLMARDQGLRMVTATPPRDQPYLPSMGVPAKAPRTEPFRLDFNLTRGVWATGKVTDRKTGRPVPAEVTYLVDTKNPRLKDVPHLPSIRRPWDPAVPTASDGTFRVPVLPGAGVLAIRAKQGIYLPPANLREAITRVVSSPGYSLTNYHGLARIDAGTKGVTEIKVVVDPGEQVRGIVEDPDGKPITGVRTWSVESRVGWSVKPLASSTFTIQGVNPAEKRPMLFEHRDRKLGALVEMTGKVEEPLKVRLQPLATLSGTVIHPNGKPWANQALWVAFFDPSSEYLVPTLDRVSTDNKGRFTIDTMIPGLAYQICIAGTPPQQITIGVVLPRVTLKPGEKRDSNAINARLFPD